jgi:hypothetical protein
MRHVFLICLLIFAFSACTDQFTTNDDLNTTESNTTSENNNLTDTSSENNESNSSVTEQNTYTYSINDGRFLVAQCAGCHGTNGYSTTSWDSIAGEGEFATDSFHGIMEAQIYGYSLDQKQAIDSYLNSLSENEELEFEEEENSESESEGSESEEESDESESNTSEEDEEDEVDETDEEDEDEEDEEDDDE